MASVQKLRDTIQEMTLRNYETEGAAINTKGIATPFSKECIKSGEMKRFE